MFMMAYKKHMVMVDGKTLGQSAADITYDQQFLFPSTL